MLGCARPQAARAARAAPPGRGARLVELVQHHQGALGGDRDRLCPRARAERGRRGGVGQAGASAPLPAALWAQAARAPLPPPYHLTPVSCPQKGAPPAAAWCWAQSRPAAHDGGAGGWGRFGSCVCAPCQQRRHTGHGRHRSPAALLSARAQQPPTAAAWRCAPSARGGAAAAAHLQRPRAPGQHVCGHHVHHLAGRGVGQRDGKVACGRAHAPRGGGCRVGLGAQQTARAGAAHTRSTLGLERCARPSGAHRPRPPASPLLTGPNSTPTSPTSTARPRKPLMRRGAGCARRPGPIAALIATAAPMGDCRYVKLCPRRARPGGSAVLAHARARPLRCRRRCATGPLQLLLRGQASRGAGTPPGGRGKQDYTQRRRRRPARAARARLPLATPRLTPRPWPRAAAPRPS